MPKREQNLAQHRAAVEQRIKVGVTPKMQCAGFHGTSVQAFRRFYETGKWPLAITQYEGKQGIYFCPADTKLISAYNDKAHLDTDAEGAYEGATAYAHNIQTSHRIITELGLDPNQPDNFKLTRIITDGIRSTHKATPPAILSELIEADRKTLKLLQTLATDLSKKAKRKVKVTPIDIIKKVSKGLELCALEHGEIGVVFALDRKILTSAAFDIKPPELGKNDEGLVLLPRRDLKIGDICGIKFLHPEDAKEFLNK